MISDEFYLKLLEKLWNEIINAHHVKIFNILIATCAAKITRNGIAAKCKDYLDNLAKYIHSFEEVRDRQFLSNDIVKTMKLLMIHHMEHRKAIVGSPANYFKMLLPGITGENGKQIVQKIKAIFPVKRIEMMEIVDAYIKTTISSNQQDVYIKFAEKIRNGGISDAQNFTFKMFLEERLKGHLLKYLDNVEESVVIKWTSMFSNLYLSNVVTIELLSTTFQALFERELNNKKIVDIINILMRKVGNSRYLFHGNL